MSSSEAPVILGWLKNKNGLGSDAFCIYVIKRHL